MKNVFSTVNGKLLSEQTIKAEVPAWIDNIQFTSTPRATLQLNTDNYILNSRMALVERNNLMGHVREIKNTFNDKTLKQAVTTKLANFLSGKRFVINDIAVNNNEICASVNFTDNPLTYNFGYTVDNGHINNNKFFKTVINGRENEYSFSKAGIEDSFNDSKNVDKKESVMVKQAESKVSKMTRMEIIRRCGGKIRAAQEAIDKQIKEGNIIPVGSNEYGSAYSMEKLFPDLNEKYVPQAVHTAEFVDNRVSTKINEHKTEERLKIEAANILSGVFEVNQILNATRDEDELLVSAEVIANNVRSKIACTFNIENEKVDKLNIIEFESGERMSVAQAMDKLNETEKVAKFLNNKNAKIAGGYVYLVKDIHHILGGFIDARNIYNLVNDLCRKKYASKLNMSTIASKYSLNELLRLADAKLLTSNEVARIRADKAYFGQGLKFYKYESNDNDTRNRVAVAETRNKHAAVNEFISRFFKNYIVKPLADNEYVITFNGKKQRKLVASVIYDKNDHIRDITCNLYNKTISLSRLHKQFTTSPLLAVYAKTHDYYDGKVILSKRMFTNKLNSLLEPNQINELINNLVSTKQINCIGNEKYASNVSFDELIRTAEILPSETRAKYILSVSDKSAGKEFTRNYQKDNDTRRVTATLSIENAKAQLARILPENIVCLSCDATEVTDNNVKFMVRCFNKNAGVARNLTMAMDRKGNELSNLKFYVGNNEVNEQDAFKTNTITAAVNILRGGLAKQFIMSTKKLKTILAGLVDNNTVEQVVDTWEKLGLIKRLDSQTFTGKVSLNNLLETSNIVMYNEDVQKQIREASKYFGDLQTFERQDIQDNDTRNDELNHTKIVHAVAINTKFSRYFKNFTVKEIGKNKFLVKFAVNDKKHKLYAVEEDGNIYCTIKNKNIPISKVSDLFKKNALLKAYAKVNKESNERSIITRKQFTDKLGGLLDEKSIDNLLTDLIKKNHLTRLSSTEYACEYGIDDLLRYTSEDIKPDENIGKQKRIQANRQEEAFEDAYIDDQDNRVIQANITEADVKQQFINSLPEDIQCLSVDNIVFDNNNVRFATKCFNKAKSNSSNFVVTADVHSAKISNIKFWQNNKETTLDDGIKMNAVSKDYQSIYANRKSDKYAIVFNRAQLENKLQHIAGLDNLDEVICNWEKMGKIKKLITNKFASEKTLVELINESNILPYTDEDIHNNFEKASAVNQYIPKQYHSKDFGSKSIEHIGDKRKKDELIKAKKMLAARIKKSYNNQFITVAKCKNLVQQLKEAKTEQALSAIQNDLNRYER